MRIAIVNSCSPDTPHVCAVRARTFAQALAAAGHEVLLLTPPLNEAGGGTPADEIPHRLSDRPAGVPSRIALPMAPGSPLPAVRTGATPPLSRRIRIAAEFIRRGHVYGDWLDGSGDRLPVLARQFAPDVVWAIFGNMGCWDLGRTLARAASCPWVGDIKDSWLRFVPPCFRTLTARRFADAAALTALSEEHAIQTEAFMHRRPTVIRSGLPSLPESTSTEATADREILMTGSLYSAERVAEFLAALERWQSSAAAAPRTRLVYAGSDTGILHSACASVPDLSVEVGIAGTLAPADLHRRQRQAWANAYIRNPPNLFHHKLLELLAAGRPVVAYPDETAEAREIAGSAGGTLFACASEDELLAAFDRLLRGPNPVSCPADREALAGLSIEAQAERLVSVFRDAIDMRR